jgi:hypothetical protein
MTVAGLALLFVAVASTAPRWSKLLRRPVRVVEDGGPSGSPPARALPPRAGAATRTINVKLFFEDPQAGGLVIEERGVTYHASLAAQLRAVVQELLHGSTAGNVAPLAGNAQVLEVFVTARGVAYVDLSREIRETAIKASRAELLAVYSLVNSITLNFPAVKRVQILIDGAAAETFAGHIDLSRPLSPDLSLLAALPEPAAGTGPAS